MHRAHLGSSRVTVANPSLVPPIRGAFYFPWYPNGWDQLGYTPFTRYTPTLGAYYDQAVPTILQQHLAWAKYANIDVLIPTWRGEPGGSGISVTTFGSGHAHMDTKIGHLLDQALQHGMKVAVYYEVEGYADPTQAQIEAEFAYLETRYFGHPAYCHVGGLPVIFVYSPGEGSTMLARYSGATSGYTTAYINAIYNNGSTPEPQGRHSFTADAVTITGNGYTIVPGFWRIDEANPRLARNLTTWQTNIASMVASGKDWQLIISWNEWGEGSQVEPNVELGSAYLDALAAVP